MKYFEDIHSIRVGDVKAGMRYTVGQTISMVEITRIEKDEESLLIHNLSKYDVFALDAEGKEFLWLTIESQPVVVTYDREL